MAEWIKQKAMAWAVSSVEPEEIDRINILNASFLAMEMAIEKLPITPVHLLIDGNRFSTKLNYGFDCIVKGDAKFGSIAAASILAKTYRDDLMAKIHRAHPHYGWDTNVGYPTTKHRKAIVEFGITPHHRKSFKLLPTQLSLNL